MEDALKLLIISGSCIDGQTKKSLWNNIFFTYLIGKITAGFIIPISINQQKCRLEGSQTC